MFAFNDAPLRAQSLDISELSGEFRDGQKLRQEYEGRQQQKALNEIMRTQDHAGRLDLARQHRYAGALVPLLQKYDEDRQKAALDNLKTSADIGKVYGETGKLGAEVGKLGAEVGKIGAETTGQVRKNVADIQNDISALAVTQNPKLFALGLGEMTKQGLLAPERTDMMLKMLTSDPQNAATIMQSMVMANPDLAKLFKPEVTYTNLGNRVESQVYDPLANTVTGKGGYNIGQSPDNKATNATNLANNQNTVAAGERNNIRTTDAQTYKAELDSKDRQLRLDHDGNIGWAKDFNEKEKIKTERIKATNPKANTPRPVAATKEMSKHLTNIKSNKHTIDSTSSWIKRIESGELNLGAMANSMNSLANRTGANSLGSNPAAYAEFKASMTKLASDALRLNSGVQTDMDYKRALEEMQAGTYIPRNNQTAVALLTKIRNDFNVKTASEYASYADYKREYDGVILPEYGKSPRSQKGKTSNNKPAKKSAGQAIGKKVFGGG